ncbi:MAG: YciI family protein [Deltaproteobacteria bacterium]|nr:YciI family protein [Deltaproteobacteria bacterium]
MRFMMLMIPKDYATAPADATPPADLVAEMMKFNQALADAGALLALDGLHPVANGARVSFQGGQALVTDGPFPEVKEVLGGYWMIQVASREEAIGWARRCPAQDGDVIEIRQVQEMEEFPPAVREAAGSLKL